MDRIEVLDHGYVRLVDWMGSDLSVANAARVSFDKEAEWEQPPTEGDASGRLKQADQRLLRFLATHEHTSPFRHATLQFEVYAPMMVKNQWIKHWVSSAHLEEHSGWNESSRRYVTEEPIFYVPEWRSAPDNRKQGSGEALGDPQLAGDATAGTLMRQTIEAGVHNYARAMAAGLCAEQARCFLPAYALYVRWRWTVSLQAVIHFVELCDAAEAQWEIRQYAKAVRQLAEPHFPESFRAFGTEEQP